MKTEIDFKGALHSIEVKPGDRFVMKCDQPISNEQAAAIGRTWNTFAPSSPLFVVPQGFELSVVKSVEEESPSQIDPRTGRPYGDHGTAVQAIEFATSTYDARGEERAFLKDWLEGSLDSWPDFYDWLKNQ